MKIKLILIMLLCLLGTTFAYDYQERFNATTLELPKNGTTEDYTFPYVENASLFFRLNQSDNRVILDFPNNHTFVNNSGNFNFRVNWSLQNQVYASNESFNTSIIITNSVNNNSQSIGLMFDVFKLEPSVVELNGTNELKIVNGSYRKVVTVDNLPDKGNLTFIIQGTPGQAFTIENCKDFLTCPLGQYNFGENGERVIAIPYSVGLDTAIGTYNTSLVIKTSDKNSTIGIVFSIEIPNIFVRPPNLPDKCLQTNMPFNVQLECEALIQDYRKEIILGYQKYNSKVNTEKICADFKEIEYVVGDSISAEVIKRNQELLDENRNLREENDYLDTTILNLKEQLMDKDLEINHTILKKDQEIQSIKEDEQQKRIDIFRASELDKDKFMTDNGFWFKLIAFVFMIIPFLLIGYKIVMRNMFLKNINLPVSILSIIGVFFGLVWLVLLLWV